MLFTPDDGERLSHRDAELVVLRAAYSSAVTGHSPRVVVVKGDGGIGKTTLIKAFADEVKDSPEAPRVGYGAAGHAGEGYGPIRWALRDILQRERQRDHHRAKKLAELISTVAPEWLGAIPGIGGILRAVAFTADKIVHSVTPSPARTLADQFLDLTLEMAQERPLVLILDDLHWADRTAAGLIFDFVRMADTEHVPLLVIASYRPHGSAYQPVERALRDLQRYVRTEMLSLYGLNRSGIVAIAKEMTNSLPSQYLVDWLERRTGGNPLFVHELLRMLMDNPMVRLHGWSGLVTEKDLSEIDSSDVPLPDTVEAILLAKLDDLTQHQRAILNAAAVLGDPVRPDDLVVVSGAQSELVTESLRALCQDEGLLVSIPDSAEAAYRFTFNLLPDLLNTLLMRDRYDYQNHHRRAAQQLEAVPYSQELSWEDLARHWIEAGDFDCALATVHRCARNAYRDGEGRSAALALAEQVLQRLRRLPDTTVVAHAEVLVAHAWVTLQNFPIALEILNRAASRLKEAPDNLVLACSLVLRASIEDARNMDYGRFELCSQAFELLTSTPVDEKKPIMAAYQRDWTSRALVTAAWVAMRKQAWTSTDQALDMAASYASEPTIVGFWNWAGMIELTRGEALVQQEHWEAAIPHLEQALSIATDEKHMTGICATQGWLGIARCHAGDVQRGLVGVRFALTCERDELHSAEGAAKWLHLLGVFYIGRSEWNLAAELLWFAKDLLQELGHARVEYVEHALNRVRDAVGDDGFQQMQGRFHPRESAWAQYAMRWGFERFRAYPDNPVLKPGFDQQALTSPTAWQDNETVVLLYGATDPSSGVDRCVANREIHLASSLNGYHFDEATIRPIELADGSSGSAVRGPIRLSRVGAAFILAYSVLRRDSVEMATARSNDLQHWRPLRFTISGWESATDGQGGSSQGIRAKRYSTAIMLPEPIDNRWWMYVSGDTNVWTAWTNDPWLGHWELVKRPVLRPRDGYFDESIISIGPRPICTEDGFLLIYNAFSETLGWCAGQALFSASDPTRLLRRSPRPLLTAGGCIGSPTEADLTGCVSGLVRIGDEWLAYYEAVGGLGAASADAWFEHETAEG